MARRPIRRVALVVAVLTVLAACSGDEPKTQSTPSTTPASTSPVPTATGTPGPLNLGAVKIRLDKIVDGLNQPVFLTHAADGSGLLYVVEQLGRIKIFERSGASRGTFLAISDRVQSGGEQGLLGLAFHPAYETNGRFFVYYTNLEGDNVVVEFMRRSALKADPDSGRRILLLQHPTFGNHNGGWIGFGRDGFLHIATGDGGGAGDPSRNGQDLGSLLGKILRIDVDKGSPYAIPPDNPFVDRSGARKEIWTYGLRNPWRESFDRARGDLWIGDVGQGAREEIDVQSSGKGGTNFGWSVMEGTRCFGTSGCDRSGLKRPVTEYPTGDGCAVTGGYVYRGTAFTQLVGAYFFGDYCNGRIMALDAAKGLRGETSDRRLLDTEISISSFGEDEAGELYVIGHGGTVYHLLGA